jgi:cytochrome bd-type quinol oxidase subunit 2
LAFLEASQMPWIVTGLAFVAAILFAGATWVRARRSDRTPDETTKMWWTAWLAGGFFFSGVLLAIGILVHDVALPPAIRYVALAVVAAILVLAVAGGLVHGLVLQRSKEAGPDPDYGELDDIPPPEGSARGRD